MIRKAIPEDLEPLTDMMMRFCDETSLKLTYDRERVREEAWDRIHADKAILLVIDEGGVLAGMIAAIVGYEGSKEPCAYIDKFYIEKEYRGAGISRRLIREFDETCERKGIALLFATSTAGMGERNEKLYVHLFNKRGYETLGRVLIKDLRNGQI